MAEDVTKSISYFLSVKASHIDHLSDLRQWTNLKAAFNKDEIWVTNFTLEQVESVEVKSIPYKSVFYEREGKLYPYNSLLPKGNAPALLWTPIELALPIKISRYNHNYFGVKEQVGVSVIPDFEPKMAEVMILPLDDLVTYVETAPEVRLKHLEWTILNDNKAMIFGQPQLPLNGAVYWRTGHMIVPVGYTFDLEILVPLLNEKLNPDQTNWLVWTPEITYFCVPKAAIQPLNLSGVRKTVKAIANKQKLAGNDR